jgi:hypothetical protein
MRSIIENLRRFFFGDDVFISYSRRHGADYALALASRLTEEKLSCYLDQWGSPPGKKLPTALKRALKRSTMLVLVGTEPAGASENVEKELTEFLKTGRSVILINFVDHSAYQQLLDGSLKCEVRGSLQKANWYNLIEGVAQTVESTEALKTNNPSTNVIDRVVNARGFTRRSKRLRSAFWTTLGGIVLLVGLGIVAIKFLKDEARKQQEIGLIRRLANESEFGLSRVPSAGSFLTSVSLAVDAAKRADTLRAHLLEADTALRHGLSLLTRSLETRLTNAEAGTNTTEQEDFSRPQEAVEIESPTDR